MVGTGRCSSDDRFFIFGADCNFLTSRGKNMSKTLRRIGSVLAGGAMVAAGLTVATTPAHAVDWVPCDYLGHTGIYYHYNGTEMRADCFSGRGVMDFRGAWADFIWTGEHHVTYRDCNTHEYGLEPFTQYNPGADFCVSWIRLD